MGAKPHVRLQARTPLVVGQPCTLTFEVTAEDAVRVEHIDVVLDGKQGWSIGHGKHRVSAETSLPYRTVRLMEAGELAAGSTTPFTIDVTLKAGTAPTHDRSPAHASFVATVQVSIPWRFDVRATFELPVRLPPPAHLERTPVTVRTPARDGSDDPRLELGLASSRLVAGEDLVGSVALFHLDDRRRCEVALVPELTLYGRRRPRVRRGAAIRVRLDLPDDHGGRAVPFRVQLPSDLTPSFETVTHALAWVVEVSSDTLFGREVSIAHPLQIVDAAAAAVVPRLTQAPPVADLWNASLFAAVAARTGWQVVPPRPAGDGAWALIGALAGGEARLTHVYRDEGSFLRAHLAHPWLGLGLTVVPGSLLRHLFWSDVEVGIGAWDRAHQVTARDAAQAEPFLRAAVPALVAASSLGSLVRWDDDELVFERPVTTLRDEDVGLAIARLEPLAAALAEARALIAPPADVAVDLPAWRELAAWLDGELAVGDLSLRGTVGGVAVAVVVERRDGRPARVRADVGDPVGAAGDDDEARKPVVLRMARPLADMLAADVPAPMVECVAGWPVEIVDLEVEAGVASAAIELAGAAPVAIDAGRVRALVLALRALLTALGPTAAPYR